MEFIDGAFERIINKFENDSSLELATFKIKTEGGMEYKNYPEEEYNLMENKHWVSSIEIAFKTKSIKSKNILFDERFGLGAIIPMGEEQVFLNDCLNNGLNCKFFPEYIVKHPYESSGKKEKKEYLYFFYMGAMGERTGKKNPNIIFRSRLRNLKNNFFSFLGKMFVKLKCC